MDFEMSRQLPLLKLKNKSGDYNMTAVKSNMLPLGTKAPTFKLRDARSNQYKTLKELTSSKPHALVIMFICNHCPFVIHVQSELVRLANNYQSKKVTFIAINSNDASTYPDDSFANMAKVAHKEHYPFPYLYDETQEVAKAYKAACTPDFYIFDSQFHCVYRGQLDDSRPGNNIPTTGKDMREALDCILKNEPISTHQKASTGCNIKWKKDK